MAGVDTAFHSLFWLNRNSGLLDPAIFFSAFLLSLRAGVKNKIKCINHLCHALKLNTHSSAINRSAAAPCWAHVLQLHAGLPSGCVDYEWLVTFACPSPSGKLLQFVSYFMRLLLTTYTHSMQLAVWVCVCKFAVFFKTTSEFRFAWLKLIRIFELLLKRNEAKPKNITKALPKKKILPYPKGRDFFFWLAPDLHIECNSKRFIYGCYSCTWIRIRVISLTPHTFVREILKRRAEIWKALHTLMRQCNLWQVQ